MYDDWNATMADALDNSIAMDVLSAQTVVSRVPQSIRHDIGQHDPKVGVSIHQPVKVWRRERECAHW